LRAGIIRRENLVNILKNIALATLCLTALAVASKGRKLSGALCALVLLAIAPIGAAWAQVQVTTADPSTAPQGTVSLDVAISGSGFDSTAIVRFLAAGTNDMGGITVKKVAVRGSRKLVATIDVADAAIVGAFDIEVALSGGRKGKGTTLFNVIAKTGGDPCNTPGLDFPAFIYWQGSSLSQQIYVADSTGKCSRPLVTLAGGAPGARFSIVGGSNVGRVVFQDVGGVSAVDFTYAGTTISVAPKRTVTPPVWDEIELSRDGDYVYAATLRSDRETPTILQRHYVGTEAAQPVSDVYTVPAPFIVWNVSANADGSVLLLELQDTNSDTARNRVVRIDVDPQTGTGVVGQEYPAVANLVNRAPAVDPGVPRFSYSEFLTGLNNCDQIKIMASDGTDLTAGQPRYGRSTTWLDGYVLATSYSAPTKSGRCSGNGYISRIDPLTSEEIYLLRGYSPEAR
jgi:hypothetical protein